MVVLTRHFISFSLSLCITAQGVQTFRLSELRKCENSSMNLYLEKIFLFGTHQKLKLGNLSIFEHKLFQKLNHPTYMASIRLLYRQSSLWQYKGPCLMLVDDLQSNLPWNTFQPSQPSITGEMPFAPCLCKREIENKLSSLAKLRLLKVCVILCMLLCCCHERLAFLTTDIQQYLNMG